MTRLTRTLVVLGAFATSCTASIAPPVQPEDLEQGFVVVVDDVARMATNERPMFLASNWGGWDPAKPEFKMAQRSDGRWQYVFEHDPARTGTIQFKFTLGSWDRVETTADGADIDNRTLAKVDPSTLRGEAPVIELTVPRFRSPADIAQQRQATEYHDLEVTGTVRRLQVAGGAGGAAGSMRDLLVWLPPGYDDPANIARKYPVLYLFDGQNLFEQPPGIPGEWHADETATRLIEDGLLEDIIIVGIPNAGRFRSEEYLPFDGGRGGEPHGAEFAAWIASEVMPRVERAFRVSTKPENTGVGGSSYGAVISLYIATQRPDRFGRLLLESLPPIGQRYIDSVTSWPERVYIGVGGSELGDDPAVRQRNEGYEAWTRELDARLERDGLTSDRHLLLVTPAAHHNEDAWAERLPKALRFLFPPQ
ncbi:MAG: alpha/beta hydrolase-fold protein [Phycisphaerales bacterium]